MGFQELEHFIQPVQLGQCSGMLLSVEDAHFHYGKGDEVRATLTYSQLYRQQSELAAVE